MLAQSFCLLRTISWRILKGTSRHLRLKVDTFFSCLMVCVPESYLLVFIYQHIITAQVSIVLLFSVVIPFLLLPLTLIISFSLFRIPCIPALVAQASVSRPSQQAESTLAGASSSCRAKKGSGTQTRGKTYCGVVF